MAGPVFSLPNPWQVAGMQDVGGGKGSQRPAKRIYSLICSTASIARYLFGSIIASLISPSPSLAHKYFQKSLHISSTEGGNASADCFYRNLRASWEVGRCVMCRRGAAHRPAAAGKTYFLRGAPAAPLERDARGAAGVLLRCC